MTKNNITCAIRVLEHGKDLHLPAYASQGAAGMDIPAAVAEPLTLSPMMRALVPTGFILEIPGEFEAQIRPRSGLAHKHGLTVANAPGTIDSDYRGEVKILLVNLGTADMVINRGDRIAQMVFAPVTRAKLRITGTLDDAGTERGSGGFGSTGI